MPEQINDKQSFFYKFLVDPHYRLWRYISLIMIMAAISFWQTVVIYEYRLDVIGKYFYILGLNTLIVYLCSVIIIIQILMPKYFITKKYLLYAILLSLVILGNVIFLVVQEYVTYTVLDIPHVRTSYTNITSVLDVISNFILTAICISGVTMPILLKYWLINTTKINQLENKQIQSEVELLKEQVNPILLSNILTKSAAIAKENPKMTSGMLMKLSQILRYQLYDTNREKVLLNAEIKFLTNYLELQKLYHDNFDFSIESEGNISKTFVSPLLFMPFVHTITTQVHLLEKRAFIYLDFVVSPDTVTITINCNEIYMQEEPDFSTIIHRLELLYKDHYSLVINKTGIILTLNYQ